VTDYFWLPSLIQTGVSPEGGEHDARHHKLASAWLREKSPSGFTGLVVAKFLGDIADFSEYDGFQHHSRGSRGRPPTGGAVLALFPDVETLRMADRLADVALCVIGGYDTNLDYWIQDRGAEAISDLEVDRLPNLPEDAIDALDGTIFFGGNNNFSGSHEKANARSAIAKLHSLSEAPSEDQIQSYLIKSNLASRGVEWFCKEYERLR